MDCRTWARNTNACTVSMNTVMSNDDINAYSEKSIRLEQMIGYLTTSYKLYWLYAVLIEVENGQHVIPFRQVVIRMITCCWYSLLKFKLHLGAVDQLYNLVIYLSGKYNLQPDMREEELYAFLTSLNDPEAEKRIAEFYKYVPYRLLQPFFTEELHNQQDYKKNRIIETLSRLSTEVFYRVFTDEKRIVVQADWAEYINKNQAVVNGWILSKLIDFLQRKNPSVPGIPMKIAAPRERDLLIARKFWSAVIELNQTIDIYTGYEFSKENFSQYGSLSIDHFIPWSFVLHDEMWNLTPTFRNINSTKNDKLPPVNPCLERFCQIQYIAFNTACSHERLRKYAEDYL